MSDDAHDIGAEQALLGAVLSDPDHAGPKLLAVPEDAWWGQRHAVIAAVITGRLRRGDPVDPQLVCTDLMGRVGFGGSTGPYLITLLERAWSVAHAADYAERVLHCAARRRLAGAATHLRQQLDQSWANGGLEPVAQFTEQMRAAMDAAEATDAHVVGEDPPASVDDILATEDEHDWIIPGLLERGERTIITGSEGLGKLLRVDEPIPTPSGWTTMGALRPGDQVYGRDGRACTVTWCSPIEPNPDAYRLTFSDGTTIEADAGHQWLTETLAARESAAKAARRPLGTKPHGSDQRHLRRHFPEVVTTAQISDTLRARNGHAVNHSIEVTAPIDGPDAVLPIDPYTLGAWLGDGTTIGGTLTLNRPDSGHIEYKISAAGYTHHHVPSGERAGSVFIRVDNLQAQLRDGGFLGHKHIPTSYLRASAFQRWALLAGLMDTDGHITDAAGEGRGTGAPICEITLMCKELVGDLMELVLSLGIKATIGESDAKIDGRVVGRRWRIVFQADHCPFTLPRHVARWQPLRTRRARLRYITAVEPCEPSPMRCIAVDSPDHMYLAGRSFLPTHNSMLISQTAACVAAGLHPFTGMRLGQARRGVSVLVVDCENGMSQTRRRYRRLAGRVDNLLDGDRSWRTNLRIDVRPDGLDLLGRDVAWLERRVALAAPQLLVVGPLYRLHYANINDEAAARSLVHALDGIRTRHHCALLTEAHPGHAQDNSGQRYMRPAGSSLFMRWPEYGFGLRRAKGAEGHHPELVDVVAWRGSREERAWPRQLRHGGSLAWEPANQDYWEEVA